MSAGAGTRDVGDAQRQDDPARRCARFFLKLIPRRARNRWTTEGAKRSPWSRSRRSAISASVMSGVSATSARMACACASIRSFVAALRPGFDRPGAPPQFMPFDRRRSGDAEAIGRASATHACVDGLNHAQAKINGERSCHGGRPPLPASILNQHSPPLGIPNDSARMENALVPGQKISLGTGYSDRPWGPELFDGTSGRGIPYLFSDPRSRAARTRTISVIGVVISVKTIIRTSCTTGRDCWIEK